MGDPEVHGLLPKYEGYSGASRDWWAAATVSCKATRCPCNRGDTCEIPSAISVGADGRCAMSVKTKAYSDKKSEKKDDGQTSLMGDEE